MYANGALITAAADTRLALPIHILNLKDFKVVMHFKLWPQDVNLTVKYVWPNVNLTQSSITLCHMMFLSGDTFWPNVKLTQSSITLGHKMSLPGGTSDQRST